MPRNSRNPTKRVHDQLRVAELYLRGVPQGQIAEAMGLSRQQVGYDLQIVQRRWRESSIRDFDQVKAEELAKIDQLERELWEGWMRSKEDAERTFTQTVKSEKHGSSSKVQMTKERQAGDPRFLDGVLKCITKRSEILGLNAPIKQEVTGRDGAPLVGFDSVVAILRQMDHDRGPDQGDDSM